MEPRPATLPRPRAFIAGLIATLVLLGTADALARLLGASTSPLTAVGLLVIRVLPTDLVKLAIALFGEADKLVLVLTVGVAGLGIGGLGGLLLRTRPRTALLTFTAAEAVLTLLVALRPEAGARDVLAAALGAVLGALAYALLLRSARRGSTRGRPDSVGDVGDTVRPGPPGPPGQPGQPGRPGPMGRGPARTGDHGLGRGVQGDRPGRRGFLLVEGAAVLVGSVGIACPPSAGPSRSMRTRWRGSRRPTSRWR